MLTNDAQKQSEPIAFDPTTRFNAPILRFDRQNWRSQGRQHFCFGDAALPHASSGVLGKFDGQKIL